MSDDLVLMSEDDRDDEPATLTSEALIALLQQHPGATVEVYASSSYGVLVITVRDEASEAA